MENERSDGECFRRRDVLDRPWGFDSSLELGCAHVVVITPVVES